MVAEHDQHRERDREVIGVALLEAERARLVARARTGRTRRPGWSPRRTTAIATAAAASGAGADHAGGDVGHGSSRDPRSRGFAAHIAKRIRHWYGRKRDGR